MNSLTPEEKFQKRMKWVKWLVGTVAAVFVAGYVVAVEISALAKHEEVDAAIENFAEDHQADHTELTGRVQRIQKAQRVQSARQKLLNGQLDLVLERIEERPHTRSEQLNRQRRERSLERAVSEQQILVVELEQELEEYPDDESGE